MSKKDLVLIGSGGMAREVRWVIDTCNMTDDRWNILGWVSKEKPGTMIDGLPVLGDDDWLLAHDEPVDVVVSVGDGALRKKIAGNLRKNANISFPVIIAPSAELSDSVELGEGSVIMNQSILTVGIRTGAFFLCNYGCTIGHDLRADGYVSVFPGAHISGNVCLEEGATIGVGASVIQGITIGRNAMIGAGAVVISDIPADSTAVGVPAKVR
ncbi:MAG: NeuD/PglB/VioB family sugar acetyltransferase [Lachnospiraceae bacterium]|nr:NeuD/PglB/VioB family sugar acetyltransferase [Lachnospiraceae bacterium]